MAGISGSLTLTGLWPLLLVRDLERSIAFYRDVLGFQIAGEAVSQAGTRYWCRLQREGISLMLQQAEAEDGPLENCGRHVAFYILCADADAWYAELTARGLSLAPPQTAEYGMRQVFVPEPDGYVLCLESVSE